MRAAEKNRAQVLSLVTIPDMRDQYEHLGAQVAKLEFEILWFGYKEEQLVGSHTDLKEIRKIKRSKTELRKALLKNMEALAFKLRGLYK